MFESRNKYIVKEFKTNNDYAQWHSDNAEYTISMITCHHPVIICVFEYTRRNGEKSFVPVETTDQFVEECANPYARKDTFDYINEYHFEDIVPSGDNKSNKHNLNQVFNMIEVA